MADGNDRVLRLHVMCFLVAGVILADFTTPCFKILGVIRVRNDHGKNMVNNLL